MATRTRRLSIFQQPPAFNKTTQNLWLFPAILFALVVIFIFIPVEYFFFPIAFGFWILLADELRKFWARKYPEGWVAWLAW
jgi:sodium/potassium-transporting ATPase subunit alpha